MAGDLAGCDEYSMVAELRALLDAAVDAIVVIDDEGRITTFNAAAERIFGYTAEQVIGAPVDVLMPEPDRSQHDGHLRRYLATGEPHVIGVGREVHGCRANGEIFPLSLAVGEAKDVEGRRFVAFMRDLSNERAADQRARSLEARLTHVARFNLVGEMAAGIAHEINQPLSAIATYAQAAQRIMQREQPDLKVLTEVCAKIDEQARRAGRVIENFRNFIRKQEVRGEPLDVSHVIADVLTLIEADAHAEGIKVTTHCAAGLRLVRVDALQLQQVLLNLTRNAVDAMRGSLAKTSGIVIGTEQTEQGAVRITVADHGPGISPQLRDHIFHPFVTTKRDGLGVGLAISRTIIQSYGGSLSYYDNPVGGAVFVVELPPHEERG